MSAPASNSSASSGEALKRIVDQVVQINTLMNEMSQAAQQQSTGIQEVNTAVSQMDQVTQQNAAMVEQSTAASRNLASETGELVRLVAFFRVGEEIARARQAAAATISNASQRMPVKPVSARPAQPIPVRNRQVSGALAAERTAPSEDWREF